jgi:CRISPR-associated protein Cmr4
MLLNNNLTDLCMLYCVTSLHAGAGQAVGAVDLPIQRERHTGWPMVQASGVKGAFRDWFQRYYASNPDMKCDSASNQAEELANKVFGREEGREIKEGGERTEGHAGAIAITDARILFFPVRSNVAPFVWVTCPAVLSRLAKDLKLTQMAEEVPTAVKIDKDDCLPISRNMADDTQKIVLEDLVVKPAKNADVAEKLRTLFGKLAPAADRVLAVSDENFSFLVRTATEVQPQIAIDMETGTTKDKSLRYQELLPADAVLYTLVFFGDERRNGGTLANVMQQYVKAAIATHVQLGGDMTMGRGIMEVTWLPKDAEVTR